MLDITPLLRRRRLVVALVFAAALAAVPGLFRLDLDNSPEGFFVQDHGELTRYRELVGAFGSDRAVRVAVSGPGLWSRGGLTWLGELEQRMDGLQGVVGAAGLYRHHEPMEGWPPADPAAFRARVAADPVDRGIGWVNADGSLASILVVLGRAPAPGADSALDVVEALAADSPTGVTAVVSGLPVVERALDREAAAMIARFFPALALVLLATLGVLFRSFRQVAAVVALVVVAEVVALGAMGASGARLDVVTGLLVPLLAVVATATGVHLLVRFRDLRHRLEGEAAARELVRQKAWPVVWAGLTTAAGFASLAAARLPAVRSLGVWAAFGFLWTTVVALTMLPCLLAGEGGGRGAPLAAGGSRWTAAARRLGRRCALSAVRRRRAVYGLFAVAALLAAAGVLRLRVETDSLAYLAPDSPVRAELAALEAAGLGAAAAHLVIELPRGTAEGFHQPQHLERLADLTRQLRSRPMALGVVSAGDLAAAEHLQPFFVSADGRRARVSLMVPMADGAALAELFATAREQAAALFPRGEAFVTGSYPLVLRAQRSLLLTMLVTVGVAMLLVSVALRLLAGGPSAAWRMLLPNLWPVLVALGVMGWAGVGLDGATVAVAAVALGLVVDDTLHTFGDYRRRAPRRGPRRAVVAAVTANAPAHLATALLVGGGFALFGLSGFVPGARFGVLTAVAVAAALAGDLLLLPSLLSAAPPPQGSAVRRSGAPSAAARCRRRGASGPGG